MDIIAALAGHGIPIKPEDEDRWRTAAESKVFPYVVLHRNRTAFAYTVNIMNAPVQVTYNNEGHRRRKPVWVLPISKAEADKAGLPVGRRMNALIMMLTHGFQQVDQGDNCWYESNGRVKGVTKARPISLLALPEDTYQTWSRNVVFPHAAGPL